MFWFLVPTYGVALVLGIYDLKLGIPIAISYVSYIVGFVAVLGAQGEMDALGFFGCVTYVFIASATGIGLCIYGLWKSGGDDGWKIWIYRLVVCPLALFYSGPDHRPFPAYQG